MSGTEHADRWTNASSRRVLWPGPTPTLATGTHLVVGYDLHPASDRALEVANDMARRLDAQLHVVHAVDLSDYPIDPDQADWEEQARASLTAEREAVKAALAGHTSGWTYHAWRGDPPRLLTAVADEYDALMLIVGTRGSGPKATLQRLIDGSVSHKLIGHQHRPVLVVPSPRV